LIIPDSEKVKGKEMIEPFREDIDFSGSETVELSRTELIPDTIVVAADSSLGTIYVENLDYHVDYDSGRIIRIQSGSIPAGAVAVAWYLYFRIYERGSDYDFDYQRGRVRLRSQGDIESGQNVFIDYTAQFSGIDDDSMDNAIAEADDQVLGYIDDIYRDSNDRSLVTAETYLAVSIVCRIKAMESMSVSSARTNSSNESKSWSTLSDLYRKEAYSLLAKYAASIGSLKSPKKA